jgi:aspartate aminotransferase-like enzyme
MNSEQPLPTIDANRYATIEQHFAHLLGAPSLFVLQGEAMIPLEAVARGVGRPGSRALNIVTGPYGEGFGQWLTEQGVEVENLRVPFNRAVRIDDVEDALENGNHFDLLSVVHAEAATGATNPLQQIASLARSKGALSVVDAVASVGADPLEIDDWALDVTIVSAQKALGGPAGVTGVAISDAGWDAIAANPTAPRNSVLSLLDWREQWLSTDRLVLPSIPNHLEMLALGETLDAVNAEGLANVIARHAAARDASRRGVRALGLELWVENDSDAAAVATTVKVPDGVTVSDLVAAARASINSGPPLIVGPAPGSLSAQALRISHTGLRATAEDVLVAIEALGLGLQSLGIACDLDAATKAAVAD